ncbi:hypothetical protein K438DRAFT_1789654 [Mycena galopus ATCC 62051]|nr:hypothetical protein K438DRAFT_1789654 [Mycena galopus ATCC 62051]
MPPKIFKMHEEHLRYLLRLQSYREYQARYDFLISRRQKSQNNDLRNREKCQAAGRATMARLRARATKEQRVRHREAQARYRERCREQIAHRARRAAVRKNTAAGKATKPRPKAWQYWSAEELESSTSVISGDSCKLPQPADASPQPPLPQPVDAAASLSQSADVLPQPVLAGTASVAGTANGIFPRGIGGGIVDPVLEPEGLVDREPNMGYGRGRGQMPQGEATPLGTSLWRAGGFGAVSGEVDSRVDG